MAAPDILAVIPVSGQDPEFRRGVPRLNRRSLLGYTFEAARSSRLIGRAVVWTDDERVARASRRSGIEVPVVRPRARRRASMAQVLKSAVEYLERRERDYRPEWIVRLQITHPFRAEGFVDRAIKTVLAQDLDSAFIALPEFDTFWYMDPDGVPQRITTDTSVPRARRTPIYRELGGLFSMVRRSVLERGLVHGERLGIIPAESLISAIDLHAAHGVQLATVVAGAFRPAGSRRARARRSEEPA